MNIASAARLVEQITLEIIEMRDNTLHDDDPASFNAIWERAEKFCEALVFEGEESLVPDRHAQWVRRGGRYRGKDVLVYLGLTYPLS
ncbi:hypothetical protein GN244_ATG09240 [Phytophthora infestans]|uniref:Uncharacterized protein n=1 Tax=Phytophthora infestans TaxID=4787 RepID=A0A833TCJ8_PHYIN|nr:hypothetical protein GN244_ATG09240 [Phytophthora infestans]KAF4128878.1 hypothetical protein GN958_ATG21939 [Phytophthora infestans]